MGCKTLPPPQGIDKVNAYHLGKARQLREAQNNFFIKERRVMKKFGKFWVNNRSVRRTI